MNKFTPKTFNIPALKGISAKNIEEHIKLYEGYVKNANAILEKVDELKKDSEKNAIALSEINRRFGFEYNGMRNHEIYFSLFEGGARKMNSDSNLAKMMAECWGSPEMWLAEFKAIALTRGIGWAMLYYDHKEKRLFNAWIDEQHLGQLQGCSVILGLDMWEHSFVFDYQPSGKKKYIEDFFENVNWEVSERRFDHYVS